jgi:hypothetical protein
MKRIFWGARLKAIWRLLTKPWFVVIVADDGPTITVNYNVNLPSFRMLVAKADTAVEDGEQGAILVAQAKDILG